jgi:hypothetical protein
MSEEEEPQEEKKWTKKRATGMGKGMDIILLAFLLVAIQGRISTD